VLKKATPTPDEIIEKLPLLQEISSQPPLTQAELKVFEDYIWVAIVGFSTGDRLLY
jgi:hypothetical protein